MLTILILGGTAEARHLAAELNTLPDVTVISSLAGRTSTPLLPHGRVRIGGFGGPSGLAAFLRAEHIGAIIDATHPFAAVISANAVDAAGRSGVPLLVLRRPGWISREGDDWRRVPTVADAAAALPRIGRRALLTTGRQTLAAFAALDDVWFLVRTVEPPAPPVPAQMTVILDRGPFTRASERALIETHAVDVVVTKDSGSPSTAAKLDAARDLSIPVLIVDRPPMPTDAESVPTVPDAVAWVVRHSARR
ncbi:cobalt-precorrin-6A reductase [Catenuloplanes sp. NPDC051500]|uniref:cobalt-precorrin-6A reductase n=1 Tax=Catenuloplanes sp. NPDC051500 TaxID=3363959 RepID=UPI0037BB81A1